MNVGDYVLVTSAFDDNYEIKNQIAKIVGFDISYDDIAMYNLDFEKDIDGHDCMGKCEYGHGWNVYEYLCVPAYNSIKALLYKRGENSS